MNIGARDLFLIAPELAMAGLAVLVVVLDLFVKRKGLVLAVAVVGLIVPLVVGINLWNEVHATGTEYAFNGGLVVDKFALYFKFLVIGILALLLLASVDYVNRFHPWQAEFIGLVMFASTGLMLLAGAGDLITAYISLELASLPVIALAAYHKHRLRSNEAALKYLVLSAVSSAVLLYGFAFLYGATGTLRIVSNDPGNPAIGQMLINADFSVPFGGAAIVVGAVLSAAGFGFKMSMVPFQMWTPDVYQGAPTPVSAFLATASKAGAFAIVLRLFYVGLEPAGQDWAFMFAVLAAVTMTLGNVVAIAQSNIKRLLGYSTIAQAGYLLVGVAAFVDGGEGPELGIESVLFYLGGYAAMNLAAFFVVIAITNRTGDESIEGLAGMGRRAPVLALILAFALISLTGIPPTVGFMGKLFLFNAAINADLLWLAIFGVVNSVISAYYYLSIVRAMYLRDAKDGTPIGASLPAWVPIGITGAAVLVLGLWPGGLLEVARTAAFNLL